jgi:hypothetical protein
MIIVNEYIIMRMATIGLTGKRVQKNLNFGVERPHDHALKVKEYAHTLKVKEYMESCSLVGVKYIAEDGRHWSERLLWILLVFLRCYLNLANLKKNLKS